MGHSYIADDVQSYDPFWNKATWSYEFTWLPRTSEISNKRIWLKKAYKATVVRRAGDFETITEYRWLTRDEYMFKALKGQL